MTDSTTTTTEATEEATVTPAEALVTGATGWAEGTVTDQELQELVRAVPSAGRTKPVGLASKAVFRVDPDKFETFLDLVNDLPSAAKATRTKASLSDEASDAIRATILDLIEGNVAPIVELAPEGLERELTEGILGAIRATVASYNGATRKVYKETLAQLIERGAVKAGQKVTGPNGASGTIKADGTVTSNGVTGSPSKAAVANLKPSKSGKEPSVNGWDFWNVKTDEGNVTLGSLRTF